jgi:transposase
MDQIIVNGQEAVSVEEASKRLNKGIATIWRWIKANKITTVKYSDLTLVPLSEIHRLQQNNE